MAKKYTAEAKTAAIREMLEKKRPVTHIARDLGISKSRLYAWSEQARRPWSTTCTAGNVMRRGGFCTAENSQNS